MDWGQNFKRHLNTHRSEAVTLAIALLIMIGLGPSIGGARAWAATSYSPISHERSNTPHRREATVGRYLYLGDVPRFAPEDLELHVSKIGLTLRVTAWVRSSLPERYRDFLQARYERIAHAFADPALSFIPLRAPEEIAQGLKTESEREWFAIARQYMSSVLAQGSESPYAPTASREEYRDRILRDLHEFYFGTGPTPASPALFAQHLGARFTPDASRGEDYAGYLTFVYPIAATAEGPFDQPSERVREIGLPGSLDSRWWSDKYDDAYGGFPFILLNTAGVAFHGPITNKAPMDVWYLRRDFVSHGCLRMDPTDVLELRALLPTQLSRLAPSGHGIQAIVTEWPDVTPIDGKLQAVDVDYYDVPPKVGGNGIEPYLLPQARATWYREHYTRYDHRLPSQNRFDAGEGESGVFYGLPHYEVEGQTLKRAGYLDAVPLHVFARRTGAVIQYQESGAASRLSGTEDQAGKYPPGYFDQEEAL